jgi:hypothetical protein
MATSKLDLLQRAVRPGRGGDEPDAHGAVQCVARRRHLPTAQALQLLRRRSNFSTRDPPNVITQRLGGSIRELIVLFLWNII